MTDDQTVVSFWPLFGDYITLIVSGRSHTEAGLALCYGHGWAWWHIVWPLLLRLSGLVQCQVPSYFARNEGGVVSILFSNILGLSIIESCRIANSTYAPCPSICGFCFDFGHVLHTCTLLWFHTNSFSDTPDQCHHEIGKSLRE